MLVKMKKGKKNPYWIMLNTKGEILFEDEGTKAFFNCFKEDSKIVAKMQLRSKNLSLLIVKD